MDEFEEFDMDDDGDDHNYLDDSHMPDELMYNMNYEGSLVEIYNVDVDKSSPLMKIVMIDVGVDNTPEDNIIVATMQGMAVGNKVKEMSHDYVFAAYTKDPSLMESNTFEFKVQNHIYRQVITLELQRAMGITSADDVSLDNTMVALSP